MRNEHVAEIARYNVAWQLPHYNIAPLKQQESDPSGQNRPPASGGSLRVGDVSGHMGLFRLPHDSPPFNFESSASAKCTLSARRCHPFRVSAPTTSRFRVDRGPCAGRRHLLKQAGAPPQPQSGPTKTHSCLPVRASRLSQALA